MLRSFKVFESGTNEYFRFCFLLVFYSNFGSWMYLLSQFMFTTNQQMGQQSTYRNLT